MKYNRLTLTEENVDKTSSGKLRSKYLCECGNIKIIRKDHVKSGKIKSCGCLNDELKKSRFNDLTNYENKYFKVLEKEKSEKQRVKWKCICKGCGNTIFLNSNKIHNQKSCGCLKKGATKERMSDIFSYDSLLSTKPTAKSTTGVRGVYYNKIKNRYIAQINVNKKTIHLGSSKIKEEAIRMRKEAELKYGYKERVSKNE